MRRMLFVFMLMAAITVCVGCQTRIIVGSSMTLAWDAPDLGDIPAEQISYEVVLAPYPTGDLALVATVATLEQAVTFASEGKYRLGVRARRDVDGEVLYSDYLWGDVEGSPQPWYVVYYRLPPRILQLRVK